MKILIVDDNEESRYMLEWLLKEKGYDVIAKVNGHEGLQQLKSDSFDLVISDILMPVMDGFTLCRKLKADEQLRKIPFIIYTATYTGPKDETLALEMGADRFVVKPSEPEEFLRIIEEVVKNKEAGKSPKQESEQPEEVILRLYNDRLVRKLEQKMLQTEKEITARRAAEKKLKRSEQLLKTAQQTGKIGGWEYDINSKQVYWTEETFRIHGLESGAYPEGSEKLIEQSLMCYSEESRSELIKAFRRCCETGEPYELESSFTGFDGEQIIVRTAGKATKENDKIVKVSGYIQDITEFKKEESEKNRLRDLLNQRQKLDSIGQLTGGIAHDYNNMLTVILGFVEIALDETGENTKLRNYLLEISKAAQRSALITRQLLTFARKQTLKPQTVNLNEIINDMHVMLRKLIVEEIDLVLKQEEDLWKINIDPAQLEQILANLIINAQEATTGTGQITVETANITVDKEFQKEIPEIPEGKHVLLKVSDTGIGMDEEVKKQLFLPFFSTKEMGRNTGLGLATVFGIVEQSNGFIKIDSEPGQGASFSIFFPVGESTEQPKPVVRKPDFPAYKGSETIFLVDDEETLLGVVKPLLERYGYRVITAHTPTMAVAMLEEFSGQIDLLITDVIMPEMNGYQLREMMKKAHPKIECIFMSGYPSNVIEKSGVIREGIHFLQKPFLAKTLAEKIRMIFDEN